MVLEMKVTEKRTVDVITKHICDVCEKVFEVPEGCDSSQNIGTLNANWGYGSTQDGARYNLDLCEQCFDIALISLKDHRKSIVMFDDKKDLPDDKFGLED